MENNTTVLQQKARQLQLMLASYSKSDPDAQEALDYLMPLIEKINSGEIVSPRKFEYKWLFFRGDNDLMKYPDLINLVADFSNAMECKREYADKRV